MAQGRTWLVMAAVALVTASNSAPIHTRPLDESYESCVIKVANYLAQKPVPDQVKKLVDKSREFYPDFTALFDESQPVKTSYLYALEKLGPQAGCRELIEHIDSISMTVPCYRELRVSILRVAESSNKAARDLIEAEYSCQMAAL